MNIAYLPANLKQPRLFSVLIFLLYCSAAFSQATPVTGRVSADESDSSLAGVTVKVKGRNASTLTGNDGKYSINAGPDAVLVITYVGYKGQEVAVANRAAVDVKLVADASSLQQIVVVGYGTQKRKDITGSVSTISSEQIAKVPVTTLDQALQGRSSGVQITNNDGAPGGGVQVQIRGIGSFGANDPLYVIDGYPTNNGINTLNPNDIATIDVLKDASATSIYGNRASNGVVIITTKRGRKNGAQVSLDGSLALQTEPKMYNVLNAQQWGDLANRQSGIDGYTPLAEWASSAQLKEADWQKAVYRTGLKQDYTLSIRGGGEKVATSFSANYFNQKGIVLGSSYKRYNLSGNIDYTPKKWLKSGTSLKFTRGDSKVSFGTGGQGASSGIGYLTKLPPSVSGNQLTSEIKDGQGNYGFFNPTNQAVRNWGSGPVFGIETQDQKNLTNYFLGSTNLEATLFDGFRIKTNVGINTNDFSNYYFTPSDTRALSQYGTGTQTTANFYSQAENSTFEWLWENTLAYTKIFGDHSIDFVGGISAQENTFRQIGGQGNNLPSDDLRDLQNLPALTQVYGDQTTFSLASQFARLNYGFKDKYLITGTVRRDGSSRFAPGHQYGVFPSGSVAWRIKQENFLQNVNAITDLKLRASYGEVGSQLNAGTFQYLAQYSAGPAATDANNNGYPFNKVYQPGLVLAQIPNPDLKWETSDQSNFGLDAVFLNGSLTLTADYYIKKSRDFLLFIPVPAQTGFTNAYKNVGSIRNSGIELNLGYSHTARDFHYSIGLNVSTLNNKVVSLSTGESYINNLGDLGFSSTGSNTWVNFSRSRIGGAVGEFYGFKSAGIFQTQGEIDGLNATAAASHGSGIQYQPQAVVGDRKFRDLNGDGIITADDQTALGSPIPKLYGGLSFDGSYKSFDFGLLFYGVSGNKIFNYQESTLESFKSTTGSVGIQNIGTKYFENAWSAKNPSQRYAVITANDFNANNRPSDVYVEDGSYLRLRNLSIGYSLPKALTNRMSIERLRIYLTAQNLFTATGYKGLDPEIGLPTATDPNTRQSIRSVTANGIDVGTYPSSRFFTFGVNVTF